MRALVCVKRVPMTGGRIVLTEDEQAIDTRYLGFTISPHEECGVEEAIRLVEAGMSRPTLKDAHFVGRAAYEKQRSAPSVAVLSTLTVDDPTSASGVKRYMLGREPVLTPEGEPLVDGKGRRSYVTSAGSGPSLGKHLLMAYLPPDQAVVGTQLAVEYFGERYPVTVAVAGATPLFDPENARIRS